ncbi:MAG: efflux RND transporter periplasmic adaptor subunit [Phycisphaerae bacterium]|nr:efflux RND transporter periplasmic adaptor subunit [Phycisphaerae bacterium]
MNAEKITETTSSQDAPQIGDIKRPPLKSIIIWAISAIIVILALAFAKYQIDTRPKAKRQKPPLQARLVTVQPAAQTSHQTFVSAMGSVIPAKEITLSPEVSGRVVFVSPLVIPGGIIQEGQTLIRIDARDYETVVKQRQSELARAELNLKTEQGSQLVAQQEYKMLDDIVQEQDQELILRKPHLEEAKAALEAAEATLASAQLDVERCTVKAPFNAVIQDKFVDVGAQVSMSSPLLKIMGTDEYWIEAKVFVDQLPWITIPKNNHQQGSSAKIFDSAWPPDTYKQGEVIRLLGQLETEGRLAQVLVSVKDPLSLESNSPDLPRVLAGSYVRVEIEGKALPNVFPINRDYLHDGDNIWIMDEDDRLKILPVNVVFRDKETVYLSNGLHPGDRIVTTDISAPVDGMPLRLDDLSVGSELAQENPNTPGTETQE